MNFYKHLKRINYFLSVIIVIIALYIILTPFKPEADLFIAKTAEDKSVSAEILDTVNENNKYNQENTLIIPEIDVNSKVNEGGKEALDLGIWRVPYTSTPDKGGNTVIIAHRFLYTKGPKTFYHLDKLKNGDRFTIIWDNKKYVYEIFETKVVEPTAVEIEDNTKESIVTLYTCTPLFTADKRLVVTAKLIE